ncbi:YtnP family quorum-quenching lactonase [Enterococcus eurekensis]|uniref:MBL fold metallo-hydrolase n=1 Tax=Enterococcus eurekensis TaxID=1159753 RepID=A0ABV9M5I3_9ENTE
METLQFHEMTLTWLDGGDTTLDGGSMFGVVPKVLWSKRYPPNDKNLIELRTDPILIQYKGVNYLIDSSIGRGKLTDKQKRNFGVTEESKVKESLQELGLTTADIDYLLMTHLHYDHASGLTEIVDGELVSVFPNAKIIVNEIEWYEMRQPNMRSKATYWVENWEPIEDQFVPYEDKIQIIPEIEMIHTGGHSDGHAIIKLHQAGETIIHMADLMPTHAHQNPLWVLAYDDYPMTSIFAKDRILAEAYQGNYKFIFYHDAYYRMLQWDQAGKEIISELKREAKPKVPLLNK